MGVTILNRGWAWGGTTPWRQHNLTRLSIYCPPLLDKTIKNQPLKTEYWKFLIGGGF